MTCRARPEYAQEAVLTTIADTTIPGSEDDRDSQLQEERELPQGEEQDEQAAFTQRPMIPVSLLTAHPGNVREDKQADRAFCQSVAAGILVPLEITTSPGSDGYIVVDGNIRLDAAVKTGQTAVPYVFSPDTADDAGLQYLHMLISSRFRRDLTVHEEAAALFSAAEAGLTRTQIRKATGLKAAEVRAGISAGSLSEKARELATGAGYEWDLEELAMLKPFEDDPAAMERILAAVECGTPVRYLVQRATDERAARARRDKLTAELRASGVTVLDQVPPGAVRLAWLLADTTTDGDSKDVDEDPDRDGQDDDGDGSQDARGLDPAGHASCPGAIAVLHSWQDEPAYYCLDPGRYGHAQLHQSTPAPFPPVPPAGDAGGAPGAERSPDPDRRLVIEGNKAWASAGTVRQRWLSEFLSRKAPPSGSAAVIARFVTTQLITMPQPLRQALGSIRDRRVYRELGGPAADAAETASQPRLWLLALAPIAAAYEDQMTGDGDQRATWRTDRYAPCPRADAGAWLRFTARLGYPLSPVEQALADGAPYLGDSADGNEPAVAGDPGLDDADGDQDDDQRPTAPGSEPGDDAHPEAPGSSAEDGDAGSPAQAA
jgi:hypothetical protein